MTATAPVDRAEEPATTIPRGTILEGVYRVGPCIGVGAMGAVYEVEHVELRRRFAAKVLGAGVAPTPEAVQRLQNEARAASAIQHQNIVDVTHLGRTAHGSVFIVMELLAGESLGERLARRRIGDGPNWLPREEALSIGDQMLAGLAAAHDAGIIHRDLKPENVFLARRSGEIKVKLLDFGISKLASQGDVRLTRTGQVFGTPLYMSPEQARSTATVDHRTDIYAAGVILYEMTTGTVPFEGSSVSECLVRHATEPPEPPSVRRPDLPAGVEAVILRALAKKPEDRFPTATALREAWHAAWKQGKVTADTLQPTSRVAAAPQRLRLAAFGAAVVALGLAAWGGAVVTSPGSPRRAARASAAPRSPLADGRSLLACPLLAASGVEQPAGWLGAAAASVACERARIVLGGRYERALVPAELLDLPRAPVDDFPVDVYGQPNARERSLRAARERAAAYLDGHVTAEQPGFEVTLRLRDAGGRELARGKGRGRALYEAVRAAMPPLIGPGALPRAARLDPEIAEWSRATTIDAALALLDLHFAHQQLSGNLGRECERVAALGAATREAALIHQTSCNAQLGRPLPRARMPALDTLSPGALRAWAEIVLQGSEAVDLAGLARRLRELRAAERSPLGRALLACAESSAILPSSPERGRELALVAVEMHQESAETETSVSLWGGLVMTTNMSPGSVRAAQAWEPWLCTQWLFEPGGTTLPGALLPTPLVPRYARRMFTLCPNNTYAAAAIADLEVAAGRPQSARRVAVALAEGTEEVDRVSGQLLLIRLDASDALFGRALERTLRAWEPKSGEAGWLLQLRLKLAWQALSIAEVVGSDQEWAERIFRRFILPEPPAVVGGDFQLHSVFAATCLRGPPTVRGACLARMRELEGRGLFRNETISTARFARGAEQLSQGDIRGAALTWRPLLRELDQLADVLHEPMAEVFEQTGQLDLAERLDEAALQAGNEYNGANMAHVRAARRAARRGDRDTALALARQVIDAWSVADVPVPAVDEMRRLVSRLERSR